LFMATGSVLYQTGKSRCTDLGGLYKSMPLTAICCIIGAASISAFPLFSGFVSKSMIITEAGNHHLILVWFFLQFASAGVVDHAGIKVPYFTFFGHDSGLRTTDPPWNMRLAMVIAAFLCVFIGVFPDPLYSILPFPLEVYHPYTSLHVVGQLQLLLFGAFAFCLLIYSGYYPAEIRAINIDFDWLYIKGGTFCYNMLDRVLNPLNRFCATVFTQKLPWILGRFIAGAPGYLATIILIPFQPLLYLEIKQHLNSSVIQKAFLKGTVPLGIAVALATVFIFILYMIL
ncbi:proton-conducting transporter membrane subunit, partial [Desulfobacterales bacterium HSG17]|nr:proton-conducting transporter membrane subunit [Desulfobacterales bacterium HSG17]